MWFEMNLLTLAAGYVLFPGEQGIDFDSTMSSNAGRNEEAEIHHQLGPVYQWLPAHGTSFSTSEPSFVPFLH
jgi:hypothetical protein